jgi:hypothetical protein
MAFSTQDTQVIYNGNGVDTTFAIPFEFTDDSSIKAEKYDITDPQNPVLIPMVAGVDYTTDTVNVETTIPVLATEQILIYRETDDDHPILYSGYQFPFSTINKDFDTLYQLVQEARAAIEGVGLSRYEQASGAPAFDFEAVKDLLDLDITQELEDLDERLDTAESTITTNTNSISTLNSTVSGLSTQVSTNTSSISTLNSTVSGLSSQVSTNTSAIATINTTISSLVTKTVVNITSNTVHPAANGQVIVVSGGTAVDITLPNSPTSGVEVIVKSRGFTGDLSILPTNALLIDGQSFKIITSLESSVTIFYTGTEWIII